MDTERWKFLKKLSVVPKPSPRDISGIHRAALPNQEKIDSKRAKLAKGHKVRGHGASSNHQRVASRRAAKYGLSLESYLTACSVVDLEDIRKHPQKK